MVFPRFQYINVETCLYDHNRNPTRRGSKRKQNVIVATATIGLLTSDTLVSVLSSFGRL